jgi:hypothetical protein
MENLVSMKVPKSFWELVDRLSRESGLQKIEIVSILAERLEARKVKITKNIEVVLQ